MSKYFDLDSYMEYHIHSTVTQDIRNCSDMLYVEFKYPSAEASYPNFGIGSKYFIRYQGYEWAPLSYRSINLGSGDYLIKATCLPKAMFTSVKKVYRDCSSLIRGVNLDSNRNNESFNFINPQRNMYLGNLLNRYRRDSCMSAKNRAFKPQFFYMSGQTLTTAYLENFVSKASTSLDLDSSDPGNYGFELVDDRINLYYTQTKQPRTLTYEGIVTLMFGRKLEVRSLQAPSFGTVYKSLKTSDDRLNAYFKNPFMIVRSVYDSSAKEFPFFYVLAEFEPLNPLKLKELI